MSRKRVRCDDKFKAKTAASQSKMAEFNEMKRQPDPTAPPWSEPAPGYPAAAGYHPQQLHLAAPPGSGQWTTGICGCCSDCSSCWCAFCCPCVVVGRVANVVERGAISPFEAGAIFFLVQSLFGLGCLYSCLHRAKLRHKYGLPEDPCNDVCTDCCCLPCSLAQTYRELSNRGIDPSLGFEMVRHIYDQPPAVQQMRRM